MESIQTTLIIHDPVFERVAKDAWEATPVIKALGVVTNLYGTIRFSFGLRSTKDDVNYLFKYLPGIIEQIQDK